MLSRVANSLYWLARNIERAETVARILDVAYMRSVDLDQALQSEAFRPVISIVAPDVAAELVGDREIALARGVFSHDNPSSITSTIGIARTNAQSVRSLISTEMWEATNQLYLYVTERTAASVVREGPSRFLRRVRDSCQAFAGITDATITHDDVWDFMQVGRFLERAEMTARMLSSAHGFDASWPYWQRLLEMCCAGEPFTRLVGRLPEPVDVLEFLNFSALFPRSIRFCAAEVDAALHRVSGVALGSYGNDAEKESGRIRARFDFTRVGEVVDGGATPFADRAIASLEALAGAIERAYFPRVPVAV